MTRGARTVALLVGALGLAAGAAVPLVAGGGWGLVMIGLLVIASVLLEPRYKRADAGALPGAGWERTGEREIDSETGQVREVWCDPLTGARRYVATDPPGTPLPPA